MSSKGISSSLLVDLNLQVSITTICRCPHTYVGRLTFLFSPLDLAFYSLFGILFSIFFLSLGQLFISLAPPCLCRNSSQVNSPLIITFFTLVAVLLHPYQDFLFHTGNVSLMQCYQQDCLSVSGLAA